MKPETTTDYDPIPEGLEFNESYMQAAFDLYDAEKKSRKRRFFFWMWGISIGIIAGLSLLFFYGKSADDRIKSAQQLPSVFQQESKQTATLSSAKPQKERELQPKQVSYKNNHAPAAVENTTRSTFHQQVTMPVDQFLPQQLATVSSTAKNSGSPSTSIAPSSLQSPVQTGRRKQAGIMAFNTYRFPKADSMRAKTTDLVGLSPDSCDSISSQRLRLRTLDPLKKHQFYLTTGLNTLFGVTELKSRFHLRESVGFNYDFKCGKRFTISSNAEIFALPAVNHYQDLGLENTTSQVAFTKTSLHYLTLGSKMDVNFYGKHHATLGAGCDILIKNTGEKYDSRSFTGNAKPLNLENYYQSFNRFNYFISVGYGYQLSPRFAFYGTYHFGLSDISFDSGALTHFDRNSRFQLVLRMRVF